MPNIIDIKEIAKEKGIVLEVTDQIVEEAKNNVTNKHQFTPEQIKENFDDLLEETEKEAYRLYLEYQKIYGSKVIKVFIDSLREEGKINSLEEAGSVISEYFDSFDKFFLSLGQSRRTRAGKTFEKIHNSLFKTLSYPFDEQIVINGKPDFLMPSKEHYMLNPMDCVIFTSKRTLRERWRQIVTEGTRGLGFFLATIDDKVSTSQLSEMLHHRIYLVVPKSIKAAKYPDSINVLSFTEFFRDHLDPTMERWKRNGIV